MPEISRRNFLKGLGQLSLTLPLIKKVPLPQVEPEPEVVEIEQEIAEVGWPGYMVVGNVSNGGIIFSPGLPMEWAHGPWKPLDHPNYTRY